MSRRAVPSIALALVALLVAVVPVQAQTEGRIGIGGSFTQNRTTDDGAASANGAGVLLRLNPKRGWGPAGAFNWFRADLIDPGGVAPDFARLRVRPLMGGIAYTFGPPELLVSASIVTGPSFNGAKFVDSHRAAPGESIDASNSWALRPGLGVTWAIKPRVGIVGFTGYMINRPRVSYRSPSGATVRDGWNADTIVLSLGAVYSIF